MSLDKNKTERTEDTLDVFDGERGLAQVQTGRKSRSALPAVLFGIVMLAVVGVYVFLNFFNQKAPPIKEEIVRSVPESDFKIDFKLPPEEPKKDPEPKREPEPTPEKKAAEFQALVNKIKQEEASKKPTPMVDPSKAGLMIKAGGTIAAAARIAKEKKDQPTKTARNFEPKTEAANLERKLTRTQTDSVGAGFLGNRNYILAKGTVINCSLQTRLDTSVPGFVSCVTTRHVYSDNGKVLLIERGSQVVGEYQGGIDEGVTRLFVLWTRVKTPNGVIIEVNSPATDPLGGAGAEGYVDTRFWTRFGTGLLLSVVDQLFNTASAVATASLSDRLNNNSNNSNNENSNNNNRSNRDINIDVGGSGTAMSGVINSVLQKGANVPQILYKNQGEKIAIFVARDLDFREVYDVKAE